MQNQESIHKILEYIDSKLIQSGIMLHKEETIYLYKENRYKFREAKIFQLTLISPSHSSKRRKILKMDIKVSLPNQSKSQTEQLNKKLLNLDKFQ